MINESWKKKIGENGEPLIVNGDFVMELVDSFEIHDLPQERNWYQLEQDLRYSPMFEKAFAEVPDKVNYFGLTLINGNLGDSSENALKFAFDSLGIEWTQNEKDALNNILQKNNFITRIL